MFFMQLGLPSKEELSWFCMELYSSDVFLEKEFIWIKKMDWTTELQISLWVYAIMEKYQININFSISSLKK